MRGLRYLCVVLFVALPVVAVEPTTQEIANAYQAYRMLVCASDCPPGQSDSQAQRKILREYCDRTASPNPPCDVVNTWDVPLTLAFDHRQRDWVADATIASRTEEDVNGIPTVDLGRNEKMLVVVTNTNPLLFTATPQDIKLEPIEQFADLQKLAGLIGGNISAILAVRASQGQIASMGNSAIEDAAKLFDAAAGAYIAAQPLADCLAEHTLAASSFVQSVEFDRTDEYPVAPKKCKDQAFTGETVRNAMRLLVPARKTLVRRCAALPESVVNILAADPAKPDAVKAAITAYRATIPLVDCGAWAEDPNVVRQVDVQIVERIENELAAGGANLSNLYVNDLRPEFEANARMLAALVKGMKGVEDAIVKLIAGAGTMAKSVETLELFRERVLANVVASPVACTADSTAKCIAADSVADFIVVPGGASRVTRWESLHTRPVKIAADSAYAADVVTRRSAVDTSYKFRSTLPSIFDIGVAVTRTDLQAPVFGAVKGDDGVTRVAIVDEESRSGKMALMLNIVPLRLWEKSPRYLEPLGIQIGASPETAKPALFWGLSYGLGKYVRIGWGGTSQRIAKLRPETPLDKTINSKDDIRQRQSYENDHYWSLMISIRALRLFTSS